MTAEGREVKKDGIENKEDNANLTEKSWQLQSGTLRRKEDFSFWVQDFEPHEQGADKRELEEKEEEEE